MAMAFSAFYAVFKGSYLPRAVILAEKNVLLYYIRLVAYTHKDILHSSQCGA